MCGRKFKTIMTWIKVHLTLIEEICRLPRAGMAIWTMCILPSSWWAIPSTRLPHHDPRWLLRLQTSCLFFSQLEKGKERESIPSSFKTFPRSCTRLFLYSIVQNLTAVVVGNCSLYFAPLKMQSPVSKEEEGTEIEGTSSFCQSCFWS